MSDAANGPDWAIGCTVSLKTASNEEVKGTVFGYDAATDTLILREQGSHGGVCNLRLLKASFVQDVVSAAPATRPPDLKLPHIDKDRAKAREEKALKAAEAALARVGEGVTKEAQSLFDALSKTMPCHWAGKTIVVMETVLVAPPYSMDSTVLRDEGHGRGMLERVQKVLAAERARLGLV